MDDTGLRQRGYSVERIPLPKGNAERAIPAYRAALGADVRTTVIGGQSLIMPNRVHDGQYQRFDSWQGYPQEREHLLNHIAGNGINGIALTGLAAGLLVFSLCAGAPFLIKLTQLAEHHVALGAAVMFLLMVVTVVGERGAIHLWRLRGEKSIIDEQNYRLQKENEALHQRVSRIRNDNHYLEKLAREELNLVRPGEVIYRFPKSKPDKD